MTSGELTVLHVINDLADDGGAEVSLVQMLARLQEAGTANVVLPVRGREDTRFRARLCAAGVTVLPAPRGGVLSRVRAARAAIAAHRPDVVHSSLWDADLAARLAAASRGTPALVSLVNTQYADVAAAHVPAPWRLEACRRVDGVLGRHLTRRFHALTEAVARAAVDALGIGRDRVTVVPRGRERGTLGEPSPQRRAATRCRLGIPPDVEVVLTVGRQVRQKGQVHLVDAFARVARRRPDALLLVAGPPGNATRELEDRVRRCGAGDRIRLLGSRQDVADLMCAADVFAFSSLWEGFGGAVLEAMAMGLPVVAFDVPAVAEVLGGTGVVVPPGDDAAMAEAVCSLLDRPSARAALGRAARDRFDHTFTIEQVSARMVDLYREVAYGGRR